MDTRLDLIMAKIIAVTGSPRGGTSLTMQIFAKALGEDRIIFSEAKAKSNKAKLPKEVKALADWIKLRDGYSESAEQKKDLNPRGFYEGWPCMGIPWNFINHKRLQSLQEAETDAVAKIVGQGLAITNPDYISKVVVIVRHPRAVARSQEKLVNRVNIRDSHKGMHNVRREAKIHNPDFWLSNMLSIAQWISAFPDVPFYVLSYERLTSASWRCEIDMNELQQFIGEGDFVKASQESIDSSLIRSHPKTDCSEEVQNQFLFAEEIYSLACNGEWEDVLLAFSERAKQQAEKDANKKPTKYLCYRANRTVLQAQCKECIKGKTVMQSFKELAERAQVDWRKEPCVYECAFRNDSSKYKTPSESIKQNFWTHS